MTGARGKRPRPWCAFHGARFVDRKSTRVAAMNRLDKDSVYRWGFAWVRHEKSGERWDRRSGSWFKREAVNT